MESFISILMFCLGKAKEPERFASDHEENDEDDNIIGHRILCWFGWSRWIHW